MKCEQCESNSDLMVTARDEYGTPTCLVCPNCAHREEDPSVIAANISTIRMVTKPTFNLNGSSPETMLEDYVNVTVSLRETIHRMSQIVPHGRDYQTVDQYLAARREHESQVQMLETVKQEIEILAVHAVRART